MSKKRKRPQMQRRKGPKSKAGTPMSAEEMFAPTEELTDKLIEELVTAQGWPEEDLKQACEMGLGYDRQRNSLRFPPTGSGMFDGL